MVCDRERWKLDHNMLPAQITSSALQLSVDLTHNHCTFIAIHSKQSVGANRRLLRPLEADPLHSSLGRKRRLHRESVTLQILQVSQFRLLYPFLEQGRFWQQCGSPLFINKHSLC